jgi:hypothetical protein
MGVVPLHHFQLAYSSEDETVEKVAVFTFPI